MSTIIYKIEFFTFWHASSGLSGSTYADLLVNKNDKKLPLIPGKTLKGLLREAAETLHDLNSDFITADFIQEVFGERPSKEDIELDRYTKEANCFFTNANLSKNLMDSIPKAQTKYLYEVIASTKIDENGLAEEGSLRRLEVTVPLTLFAKIEHFPEKETYQTQIGHCFDWVKKMGLNRSRGLGRCQFSFQSKN